MFALLAVRIHRRLERTLELDRLEPLGPIKPGSDGQHQQHHQHDQIFINMVSGHLPLKPWVHSPL